MSGQVLTIAKNSEYKIRVEGIHEFEHSFFREIYRDAAKNVTDIIKNAKDYYKDKESGNYIKDKEGYNNIIAFVGERGAGKSSAMVSFAEALKNLKKDSQIELIREFEPLTDIEFSILDIIDPSLFECNESIFEVIIAKMFAHFKDLLDNQGNTIELESKRKLLRAFEKVYQNLRTIDSNRKELYRHDIQSENILETLSVLASGSNMRESFIELINEYLAFFCNSRSTSERFLVIAIDDLDMNIKHAASMVEQIRKYLLLPNIIILIAIKLEQLTDSIEQEYRNNFRIMLEKNKSSDFPKDMSTRYIEKLIPNGRKLFLPKIRATRGGALDEIQLRFIDEDGEELYRDSGGDYLSIEEFVLRMTFMKTGLVFIRPIYSVHYLVPDNLRELQNYISMLYDMPDVNGCNSSVLLLNNIEKFEQYFINVWVKNNLPLKCIDIINEFMNVSNKLKNKFIVKKINEIVNSKGIIAFEDEDFIDKSDKINIKIVEEFEQQINELSKKISNPLNISIGDVISLLKLWNQYDDRENAKKFSFVIKTIYTIALYRLVKIDTKESDSNKAYEKIAELTGGDFFGNSAKNLIRGGRGIWPLTSYQNILIGGQYIGNVVEDILKRSGRMHEVAPTIQLIETLHYFLFLGSISNDIDDIEVYYETEATFINYVGNICIKNATFNVGAFIFFLLNPEENLKRIFMQSINGLLENRENKLSTISQTYKIQHLFNEVKNYSLCNKITRWQKTYSLEYPMVIPIYSVELLEEFVERAKRLFVKRAKSSMSNSYSSYLRLYIQLINEAVKSIYSENKYIDMFFTQGNFDQYYWNCPLIKNLEDGYLLDTIEFEYKNSKEVDIIEKDTGYISDKDVLERYHRNLSFRNITKSEIIIKRVRDIINSLKDPRSEGIKVELHRIIVEKIAMFKDVKVQKEQKDLILSLVRQVLINGIEYYKSLGVRDNG